MSLNFDSLKKSITKQPIAAGIGFLFLTWIIDNILFAKVPYKIGTQEELGLTKDDMETKLSEISLPNYKTSYARFFRFGEKYVHFLKDFEKLGDEDENETSLECWDTLEIQSFFSCTSCELGKVSVACYNKTENLFIIVLKS